jgi:hypothetical protein
VKQVASADARRKAGYQLDRVQRGLDPDSWKPMPDVGGGVREIRIRGDDGAFRVIYVGTFSAAVYVPKRKRDRRLNDLVRGRIDRFSLDALVTLNERAGLKARIEIMREPV